MSHDAQTIIGAIVIVLIILLLVTVAGCAVTKTECKVTQTTKTSCDLGKWGISTDIKDDEKTN